MNLYFAWNNESIFSTDPVFEILQLHYTILSNASFYDLMFFQL